MKVYYYATTVSSQDNTNVELRLYANSQSYVSSGGWAMYIGTTTNNYDLVDMYKTRDTAYNVKNAAPSETNLAERLYDSPWADGGGYSKIVGLDSSTNTIVVRLYRSSLISFPNVYIMKFRFYVERMSFSGIVSVNIASSRLGNNFRT